MKKSNKYKESVKLEGKKLITPINVTLDEVSIEIKGISEIIREGTISKYEIEALKSCLDKLEEISVKK